MVLSSVLGFPRIGAALFLLAASEYPLTGPRRGKP